MTLYASTDGENYSSLGSVYMPASPQDPAKFTYTFRLSEILKARYIRLSFSRQEMGWFFIDEISAYAYSADYEPEQDTVAQYYGDPTIETSEPSYWPESDADNNETINLALGVENIYVQHFSELEPEDAVASLNTPDPAVLTDGTHAGVSWDSSDVFRMTRGDGRRITLDLGHISAVERVEFDMLILTAWGVYPVGEVGVLVSENGTDWQSVATVWVDYGDATSEMLSFTADLGGVRPCPLCVPADADQGALRYERDRGLRDQVCARYRTARRTRALLGKRSERPLSRSRGLRRYRKHPLHADLPR